MKTDRERHAELDRLLKQAIQCLESLNLRGANEALERANVEAASPRNVTTGYTGPAGSKGRRRS